MRLRSSYPRWSSSSARATCRKTGAAARDCRDPGDAADPGRQDHFKPRLREIAAEQAARELIAAALPGVAIEISAVTDAERGLGVKAKAPCAHCERVRTELDKLPLASDVVAA